MIGGDIALDVTRRGSRPLLPEFPESLHWVNRADRVRLADWRGQIVLVLFWNGASTSSLNLLAELRQLEKRHPDAFVSVCVHTPRYVSQRSDSTVLKAAHRQRLRMPVANDHDGQAWKQFTIGAWPTTLLIDANGALAARLVGESRGQEIEDAIIQLRDEQSVQTPFTVPEPSQGARTDMDGALAFPAHALVTENRLFVSDTGHHRILECSHDGRVLRQFGSGTPGNWDGQFAACGLQSPQGLAIERQVLYVADSGNHCVRRIRLDTGDVETVLGAGRPAYTNVEAQGGGLRVAINAPHAVVAEGDVIYVAATGQHQILRADLRHQQVTTVAGDGRSEVRDGIGGQSSLSQPMALAPMPGQLLVADAGGNAVRRLRFADLAMTTLAGSSPWEPGNRDGPGDQARLAYPCGLAIRENRVYVADTMNDRLCTLDPYSGQLATVKLDRALHEPQGLSFAAGSLWLADRNEHAILRIDPERRSCERVPVDE
ncbi:MAG TPA: redoxin domain-containing protein [Rhodanobacteraceae bacterium]|nr:redoxin domain-containing protein [Rhodanobacteraceae bacterium]